MLIVAAVAALGQPPEEFQRAYELAGKKQFAEAIQILDGVVARGEHLRNAHYSIAVFALELGQPKRALDATLKLKELEPASGKVRGMLVRIYQALDEKDKRDTERAELLALRKDGKDADQEQLEVYERDVFRVGERQVRVVEYFELKGDRATRYSFAAFGPKAVIGKDAPEFRIILGSFDSTNAIWEATTKPKPKKGQRLFHIDAYYAKGVATVEMITPEPTYDEVKAKVIAFLEKQ